MDNKLSPIYGGLVVNVLDSQSRDLVFKTTGLLYGDSVFHLSTLRVSGNLVVKTGSSLEPVKLHP